jgi:hypothetical protein
MVAMRDIVAALVQVGGDEVGILVETQFEALIW